MAHISLSVITSLVRNHLHKPSVKGMEASVKPKVTMVRLGKTDDKPLTTLRMGLGSMGIGKFFDE